MAEGGVDFECVAFDVLERYQREYRCMCCKKQTFRDMITCEHCQEFRYCSVECLERDREKHWPQCNVLCVRKGTSFVFDRQLVTSIRKIAKSLDDEGNFVVKDKTQESLDGNKEADGGKLTCATTKKRRKRGRKNRKNGKGKNTNIAESKKSGAPTPDVSSYLAGGKFGGKVTVDAKVKSGTRFGDGWWAPKGENDSGNVKEGGGLSSEKLTKSRFPEYDTDTDSDGAESRRPRSTDEGSKILTASTSSGSAQTPPISTVPSERLKEIQESKSNNSTFNFKAEGTTASISSGNGLKDNIASTTGGYGPKDNTASTNGGKDPEDNIASTTGCNGPKDNTASTTGGKGPEDNIASTNGQISTKSKAESVEERTRPSIQEASTETKSGLDSKGRFLGGKVNNSDSVKTESGATNSDGTQSQGFTATGVGLVPYDKQKAGEAEAAAGGGDPSEAPKLEKCLSCSKESYTMLKCARCKFGRYCNKACQKRDFPKHKEKCRRTSKFAEATRELPIRFLFSEYMRFGFGGPRLSWRLGDLRSEFEYMFLGVSRPILLQITGPYFHPFRHGVTVRDVEGVTTHIMFYNQSNIYYHVIDEMPGIGLPIPLGRCLHPGNFILLFKAFIHMFFDGTVGIRIDDLEDVHFVFQD